MTDITPASAPEADDVDVAPAAADNELQFGGEGCELLSHEAVVSKRDGMVIVRVFGRESPSALKHIGTSPMRAMRLGARLIQAAMHADPSLISQADAIIATARQRGLKVVKP
jgi:hypothetical protein